MEFNVKRKGVGKIRNPHSAFRNGGFTLIEMLAVMGIMALMLAITLTSYFDWSKTSAMRGSLWNVKSSLEHARQWAVTHRTRTTWLCANTPGLNPVGCYVISTNTSDPFAHIIGQTNYVAGGIEFDLAEATNITFGILGKVENVGVTKQTVTLEDNRTGGGDSGSVVVYALTGRTRIDWD